MKARMTLRDVLKGMVGVSRTASMSRDDTGEWAMTSKSSRFCCSKLKRGTQSCQMPPGGRCLRQRELTS